MKPLIRKAGNVWLCGGKNKSWTGMGNSPYAAWLDWELKNKPI